MVLDVITSTAFHPVAEVLSQTIEAIIEAVVAAKDVCIEKDSFAELASFLHRIVPILKELNKKNASNSEGLSDYLDILSREVKAAKGLIMECRKKNRVYLLLKCRSIARRIENITREISRALSLVPFSSLDVSSSVIEDINQLCANMRTAQFNAAIAEEEILERIESGIQERNVDRSYANKLLVSIAEAVGIPTEQSALKKEFAEFKSEIENALLRKDQAEAIQLDQIIALLERADATSSSEEKEIKYLTKRNSLGSQPLEPLQPFVCPITREVMVDPVETSSGHTFDRSAIEKWLSDGNNLCPLTMLPLETSALRPNKTLRQSIEEWKDRNTMIAIASMKPKLLSDKEEEVLNCLEELVDLSQQRDIHREWVVLEGYIPSLIQLLGKRDRDIRNRVLVILLVLAKDSDEAKCWRPDYLPFIRLKGCEEIANVGERYLVSESRGDQLPFVSLDQCVIPMLCTRLGQEFDIDQLWFAQGFGRLLLSLSVLRSATYCHERIFKVDNAIESIVRSLGRRIAERKLAVALLLELSKNKFLQDCIGKVQGCILLLVTMSSSDNNQAARDARELLENLSFSDENVVQMAKANYFKPLLQRLSSGNTGSDAIRIALCYQHIEELESQGRTTAQICDLHQLGEPHYADMGPAHGVLAWSHKQQTQFLWVILPDSVAGGDWETKIPVEIFEGTKERGLSSSLFLGNLSSKLINSEVIEQQLKADYVFVAYNNAINCNTNGSEDVKMTMAKTLAEMELTDSNKSSLFEEGALDSLLHLLSYGDVKIKEVAAKALQNLSSLPKNGSQMLRQGAEALLLDILCRHTSSQTLRELIAATIMHLAMSTAAPNSSETPFLLLESEGDTDRLFSLINHTGPLEQQSILQAFHAMCLSPSATNVKSKLRQCSALQILVQLCEIDSMNVRANAVKLLFCLTEDGDEATISEHVGQKSIETLIRIIRTSNDEEEIASSLGIISNLPQTVQIMEWLLSAGGLQIVISHVLHEKHNSLHKSQLVENATGALCRFTDPRNQQLQKKAAEAGIIPKLVQLLESGTRLTKRRAAISLAQFCESSLVLSQPIPKHKRFWCFSAPPEAGCPVHQGICTVESSFCLVEAGAVVPLARLLEDPDHGSCEAALDALLTFIVGERLQTGSKVLAEANALLPMIKLLAIPSPKLQEKVLMSLERIFQLVEFRQKYGPAAQMPLVDLTQRGNSGMKSLAAKVLAQLNVLHDESSYF
ncbi:hypothetical protein RJ639_029833 [Escallonia herrerae]|uniref:RING-type E3 ubiquitin transferase n=1 Tax=Escallonia herrerae TaxID=1293975 RepID=A0AA88XD18_9ASTE|nr:hypothetical protein RJ639_029833 [Escallonia herrerae]